MRDDESVRGKNSKVKNNFGKDEQIHIRYYPHNSSFLVEHVSKCAVRKNQAGHASYLIAVQNYASEYKKLITNLTPPKRFNIPIFINAIPLFKHLVNDFDENEFRQVVITGDVNQKTKFVEKIIIEINEILKGDEIYILENKVYISRFNMFLSGIENQSVQKIREIRRSYVENMQNKLASKANKPVVKIKKRKGSEYNF